MRIALFSDTFVPEINGVATSTFNLQKTLISHGNECVVVTTNPFNNKVTFEDNVIRIPGIYLKRLYGYRLSMFFDNEAYRIIKAWKPDVIHCQTDAGIGIFGKLVSIRFKIPVVYTYHTMLEDYAYYITKGHFDRVARTLVKTYFKGKASRYSCFIAPSLKIKEYLRGIGIDSNISVIPTGIELDRFKRDEKAEKEALQLRKKYGIDENDYVVLSLGRIAKEKSIDLVIKGYAKFLENEPCATKMVITGWGPAEQELKELASSLGIADKVIFTGKCAPDETQKFYHLGNCFVSASITETQGLTFMEAMASSLVVLARYDDNLEGTIEDGKTGFFFYDEDDLAKKIGDVIRMSEEKRKVIIKQSLQSIDMYSMEKFYQNVMEVYQRVKKATW